jgi:peptide/nickel transport system permease protein
LHYSNLFQPKSNIMLIYFARRFATALITIFLSALLVFLALLAIPGDPAQAILGLGANETSLNAVREQLGLNQPPLQRFLNWLAGVVHGEFGNSLQFRQPVLGLMLERIPVSLVMSLAGTLLACLIGIPLGIFIALNRNNIFDPIMSAASQLGAAIPSFWLGLMLILLFSVQLGWLPAAGFTPFSRDPLSYLRSLILPVLTLGLGQAAIVTRMTRAAMIETLLQDYTRTARSKGLSQNTVVWKHALRNALITIVTIVGISVSSILIGSIIIEQVFSVPGLGSLTLTAVRNRDFPLLQGQILVYASFIILINFLVDISYGFLDPRVRYE